MGIQAKLTQKASFYVLWRKTQQGSSQFQLLAKPILRYKDKGEGKSLLHLTWWCNRHSFERPTPVRICTGNLGPVLDFELTRGEQQHVGVPFLQAPSIPPTSTAPKKQIVRYCFIKNSDCRVRAMPSGTMTMQGHIIVNKTLPTAPQPPRCSQGPTVNVKPPLSKDEKGHFH